MFSKLSRHKPAMGAMLVASIVLAASLVAPAVGAPSPLTVAKKALSAAKKANKTARSANKRSQVAAKSATAAKGAAGSAGATAGAALAQAGQALAAAQGAAANSGPAAIRFSTGATVPTNGSSVEDAAFCPEGYAPAGGGVIVVDENFDPVTSGIAITESMLLADGWVGAVQDTGNTGDRQMFVAVTCAKPSSIDAESGLAKRRAHGR